MQALCGLTLDELLAAAGSATGQALSLIHISVMRLTAGSLVAETVRLSMLKPRRQNRLDTRAKKMCIRDSFYSAGGSSVLMLYICVGLVLSVYMHNTKSLFG